MTTATTTETSIPARDLVRRPAPLERRASRSSTPACPRSAASFKPIEAKLVSSDEGIALCRTGRRRDDLDRRRGHPPAPALGRVLRRRAQPGDHLPLDRGQRPGRRARRHRRAGDGRRLAAGRGHRHPARPGRDPRRGDEARALARATVDRTAYGMDWQMELPGGGRILANEVTLLVELEFNLEG